MLTALAGEPWAHRKYTLRRPSKDRIRADSLTYLAAIPLMTAAMNTTPMTGEVEAIDLVCTTPPCSKKTARSEIDLEYLTETLARRRVTPTAEPVANLHSRVSWAVSRSGGSLQVVDRLESSWSLLPAWLVRRGPPRLAGER
jgi:hypothetical protein